MKQSFISDFFKNKNPETRTGDKPPTPSKLQKPASPKGKTPTRGGDSSRNRKPQMDQAPSPRMRPLTFDFRPASPKVELITTSLSALPEMATDSVITPLDSAQNLTPPTPAVVELCPAPPKTEDVCASSDEAMDCEMLPPVDEQKIEPPAAATDIAATQPIAIAEIPQIEVPVQQLELPPIVRETQTEAVDQPASAPVIVESSVPQQTAVEIPPPSEAPAAVSPPSCEPECPMSPSTPSSSRKIRSKRTRTSFMVDSPQLPTEPAVADFTEKNPSAECPSPALPPTLGTTDPTEFPMSPATPGSRKRRSLTASEGGGKSKRARASISSTVAQSPRLSLGDGRECESRTEIVTRHLRKLFFRKPDAAFVGVSDLLECLNESGFGFTPEETSEVLKGMEAESKIMLDDDKIFSITVF